MFQLILVWAMFDLYILFRGTIIYYACFLISSKIYVTGGSKQKYHIQEIVTYL